MAYPPILVDQDGNPIPQRWNAAEGKWEPYDAVLLGPDGQPISSSNPLHVIEEQLRARIGALNDAAVTNPALNASVIAALKGILTELGTLAGTVDSGAQKVTLSGSKALISSAPVTGVKTVTGIAAEIFAGSSRKAGRSLLMIRNLSPAVRVRVGRSGVTDQTGFGIEPEAVLTLTIDPASDVPVYAISEAGDVQVEVLEA